MVASHTEMPNGLFVRICNSHVTNMSICNAIIGLQILILNTVELQILQNEIFCAYSAFIPLHIFPRALPWAKSLMAFQAAVYQTTIILILKETSAERLLVMPDSHVNALVFQRGRSTLYVRLTVVIGEQHLWLDDLCGIQQLINGHGEWLVARQERNINILDVCHFGNILRIASDVDAQAVDG